MSMTNVSSDLNDQSTAVNSNSSQNSSSEKSQRRSNVERSATTRAKVTEAAIQCLYELGYEGTTVILVAKKAGVSRGAAQHQFPSKVDLMMAVVEQVIETQNQTRAEIWENLPETNSKISHLVEASWDIHSQPDNVALFEIMMATRNDEVLNQRFLPFAKKIADLNIWGAERTAQLFNIDMQPKLEALVRLHFSAMRGISMDLLLNKDEEGAKASVDLLKEYQRIMIEKLIQESGGGSGQSTQAERETSPVAG